MADPVILMSFRCPPRACRHTIFCKDSRRVFREGVKLYGNKEAREDLLEDLAGLEYIPVQLAVSPFRKSERDSET